MLINARSLTTLTVDNLFNIILHDEQIQVCCITETWLKPSNQAILADIKLRGYNIISSPRAGTKRGGGVAFLCENKYISRAIKTVKYTYFELLEVIFECKNLIIRFSTIYRTGTLNIIERAEFLDELDDYLGTLLGKKGINIIWGDFNINRDLNSYKNFYRDFIELFTLKNYIQIVNQPTHIKEGILDLIFIPLDFSVNSVEILNKNTDIEISDHYPIKIQLPVKRQIYKEIQTIEYRNLKNINLSQFMNDISLDLNCNLVNDINNHNKLDYNINFILKTLSNKIDHYAPKKKVLIKTNHLFTNSEIKEARRKKRRAERKLKKLVNDDNKKELKLARKELNKVITLSRNIFFQNKFESCKGNLKQTYKIFNELINQGINVKLPNHYNELELANDFANYYSQKILSIRNELINKCKHVSSFIKPHRFKVNTTLNKFESTTKEEVESVVKSLINKQSLLDSVPCELFKKILPVTSQHLSNAINYSFQSGKFPSSLKLSIVSPIIKSLNLDSDILNNYRPVSNLSILSKIFEKIVLSQLNCYLETNNLLSNYQSAYRANYSCETAVLKVLDDVFHEISPKSYVLVSFLDFSAAFDTVDHTLLINKLRAQYGITGLALQWFDSYLNDRTYRVKIKKSLSDTKCLKFGVPQGSILGPILYSMYVKEIEDIANNYNVHIHVYADDVVLYSNSEQIDDFKICHKKIEEWTIQNYLKLNNKKTQFISLSTRNNIIDKISNIDLMGENITASSSAKYLGVWLDENLTMSKQISSVCSHGYMILKNLWKISNKLNSLELKKQLIHSCILSKLNFCSSLYYNLPKKQLRKLDKLLNASARFIFNICGSERRQHITPFLQKLHFLPIAYRSEFKLNLLVYKSFQGRIPNYLAELIQPKITKSLRTTRKDDDITWLSKYPIEKTNYKNRGFRYSAPVTWNSLSQKVRESSTIQSFKSNLKTHYFNLWRNKT